MAEADDGLLEEANEGEASEESQKSSKFKFKLGKPSRPTLIKIGIALVVIIVLSIGAFFFLSSSSDKEVFEDEPATIDESTTQDDAPALDEISSEFAEEKETETASATSNNAVVKQGANAAGDIPNTELKNNRLAAISQSMQTVGIPSASTGTTNSVASEYGEMLTPMTPSLIPLSPESELEQLKAENELLKQQLDELKTELLRKDYIIRTAEIMGTQPNGKPIKEKFEPPIHVELEPMWGDFSENKPKQ